LTFANSVESVANLLCVQANSASYLQRDRKRGFAAGPWCESLSACAGGLSWFVAVLRLLPVVVTVVNICSREPHVLFIFLNYMLLFSSFYRAIRSLVYFPPVWADWHYDRCWVELVAAV